MNYKQFKKFNEKNIRLMTNDKSLHIQTLQWIKDSWKYQYCYHFSWLGLPIIQFPQDIVAIQELIWKIKPDLIIETGIARGGSIILYASLLELIGKGNVIGIDIDIKKQNRKFIEKHKLFKRITMLQGSSINNKIINQVYKLAKNKKKIMVLLDSNHTHKHVLKEMEAYSTLVSKGSYMIVFDTQIELLPENFFKNNLADVGNNPMTAIKEFLEKHKNFKSDKSIQNKLLITSCPDGYLKRIK